MEEEDPSAKYRHLLFHGPSAISSKLGSSGGGGTHIYICEYHPGTYCGGKGAFKGGKFALNNGTVLNNVLEQRGGDSVDVEGGQSTSQPAAQLGKSVEDNAGTGGGGGSFVYTTDHVLLLDAGGGGVRRVDGVDG